MAFPAKKTTILTNEKHEKDRFYMRYFGALEVIKRYIPNFWLNTDEIWNNIKNSDVCQTYFNERPEEKSEKSETLKNFKNLFHQKLGKPYGNCLWVKIIDCLMNDYKVSEQTFCIILNELITKQIELPQTRMQYLINSSCFKKSESFQTFLKNFIRNFKPKFDVKRSKSDEIRKELQEILTNFTNLSNTHCNNNYIYAESQEFQQSLHEFLNKHGAKLSHTPYDKLIKAGLENMLRNNNNNNNINNDNNKYYDNYLCPCCEPIETGNNLMQINHFNPDTNHNQFFNNDLNFNHNHNHNHNNNNNNNNNYYHYNYHHNPYVNNNNSNNHNNYNQINTYSQQTNRSLVDFDLQTSTTFNPPPHKKPKIDNNTNITYFDPNIPTNEDPHFFDTNYDSQTINFGDNPTLDSFSFVPNFENNYF